jgi:hypothetical protein
MPGNIADKQSLRKPEEAKLQGKRIKIPRWASLIQGAQASRL